ncbi:MAG TPA: TRAP transporter substrate-binding protein DctP, partial [Kofleriaceae bacterium]|nr:TRAP transporter substrate-binding protein DctP [Kofleriaceae bacterium]
MSRFAVAVVMLAWLVPTHHAAADEPKHKLRISTAAPDGTSWANTFIAFGRDIAKQTHGEVELKYYFGGIAGDEMEVYDLMQAGKLDGIVSGGPLCRKVAPSMRVLDVIGLFQNQEEAQHVLNQLRPTLTKEAHDNGYALLATGSLGPIIMFSREPITSMADLQKSRLWTWDLNTVFIKEGTEMKIPIVGTGLTQAQKAFDEKRTDGF